MAQDNLPILYDISLLGNGYLNPRCKTGLYRVTEQLLLELAQQPSIQLSITGLNGISTIWEDASSFKYAQVQNPDLFAQYHPAWKSRLGLDSVYRGAAELQKRIIHKFYQTNSLIYTAAIAWQVPFKRLSKFDIQPNLKSETFDVFHSPYYALPDKALTGKAARVITIHDMIPILFPQFFTPKIVWKFKKNLESIDLNQDWVICNSQHTKNDFCNYTGMSSDRVFITPLAAGKQFHPVTDDAAIAQVLQRYQISSPYLLSLATLEPRKNLSFLIRCFSRLIKENPDWDLSLVLVGVSGWKNTAIFQAVQEDPQLKSRVVFTDYVPDTDLSAIFSGATAFVYPSFYEGFGLPPLEAMQCGTPVITSNTSSLPEVVGDAGILIDPTNEDDLCEAIGKLVSSSELRSQLSQKSLKQASQFSWTKCAEQTVEIYYLAAQNTGNN